MTEFTTIQRTRRCLQSSALLLLACLPMLAGCAVGSDTWYTRISDSDREDHDTGSVPFDFSGAGEWTTAILCRSGTTKATKRN